MGSNKTLEDIRREKAELNKIEQELLLKQAKEKETGITIHYVNEHYDEGAVIFQTKTSLNPTDTVAEVAQKTHLLEHEHFAPQIHQLLNQG